MSQQGEDTLPNYHPIVGPLFYVSASICLIVQTPPGNPGEFDAMILLVINETAIIYMPLLSATCSFKWVL
jgi:hypothetical protein